MARRRMRMPINPLIAALSGQLPPGLDDPEPAEEDMRTPMQKFQGQIDKFITSMEGQIQRAQDKLAAVKAIKARLENEDFRDALEEYMNLKSVVEGSDDDDE